MCEIIFCFDLIQFLIYRNSPIYSNATQAADVEARLAPTINLLNMELGLLSDNLYPDVFGDILHEVERERWRERKGDRERRKLTKEECERRRVGVWAAVINFLSFFEGVDQLAEFRVPTTLSAGRHRRRC